MKIVHIHLMGPYTDGWGYQENVLPAIQARQGHDVTVITGCQTHHADNSIVNVDPCEYEIDGVKIIRVDYKTRLANRKIKQILHHYPVHRLLNQICPDVILLHGLGRGLTNVDIKQYIKKHAECAFYGDVHVFEGNVSYSKSLKARLLRWYDEHFRKILYPYYRSVLCISQQCYNYARDIYKIKEEKLKIFPLGYDPANIDWAHREQIRKDFRAQYGIGDEEIVIVHGGKIIPRRKTEMAVDTVCGLKQKVRLIVFGSIEQQLREKVFKKFEECEGLIYLDHLSQKEYLKVFLAADIALFPGAQSSMWEEAIGCGLPLLINCTEKKDASYYDRGGNVAFSTEDTVQSFISELENMLANNKFKQMAYVAQTAGRVFFSYERVSDMMLGKDTI